MYRTAELGAQLAVAHLRVRVRVRIRVRVKVRVRGSRAGSAARGSSP